MPEKLTEKQFIQQLRNTHGTRYDYSKVLYKGMRAKILIVCRLHGGFEQRAQSHASGQNCPECNKVRVTTEDFIKKAEKIHRRKYDYSKTRYVKNAEYVTIICKQHGKFKQLPSNHLLGFGCAECAVERNSRKRRKSPAQFINELKAVHGELYTYGKCRYTTQRAKVIVTCKSHGDFQMMAGTLLLGSGCPECRSTRYSGIAIRWIEEYAKSHRMKNVQHGRRVGEFRIPGTKYRVDGYHKSTNTVFEFYGDRWHGNPNVYKPSDRCHPYSDKTARELYKATMARESCLRKLGYRVVSVWESDYRASR